MSATTEIDAAWFEPHWNVDLSTARPVAEGVWRAERKPDAEFAALGHEMSGNRHAIYFNPQARIVVSLATGWLHSFDMHHNGGTDYETYVFRAAPNDAENDVCCHATDAGAE